MGGRRGAGSQRRRKKSREPRSSVRAAGSDCPDSSRRRAARSSAESRRLHSRSSCSRAAILSQRPGPRGPRTAQPAGEKGAGLREPRALPPSRGPGAREAGAAGGLSAWPRARSPGRPGRGAAEVNAAPPSVPPSVHDNPGLSLHKVRAVGVPVSLGPDTLRTPRGLVKAEPPEARWEICHWEEQEEPGPEHPTPSPSSWRAELRVLPQLNGPGCWGVSPGSPSRQLWYCRHAHVRTRHRSPCHELGRSLSGSFCPLPVTCPVSAARGPAHPQLLASGSASPFKGGTWAAGRPLRRRLCPQPWCGRCGHHPQSSPARPRKLRPWGRSCRADRSSSRPAQLISGLADRSSETSEGQRGRHLG